jgi:hypothetical protein
MILWVEVTNVASGFDKLFQRRFLIDKIRLAKKNSAAATVSSTSLAFETRTLSQQSVFPKITFTDDYFHSLEPPWHCGMIFIKIK